MSQPGYVHTDNYSFFGADELAAAKSAVLDTSPTGTRLALAEVSRAVEKSVGR